MDRTLDTRSILSAASGDSSVRADPVNHLETTVAGFKLTGFAEGSYAYSGRSVGDTAIVGRLYDRLQNRFTRVHLGQATSRR